MDKQPATATLKDVAKILVMLTIATCTIIATVQFVQVSNRTEEAITRLTRDTTTMERAFRDMATTMKDTYAKDTQVRDELVAMLSSMKGSFNDVSAGFRRMSNAVENSLAAIPPATLALTTRLDDFSTKCEGVLGDVGGELRDLIVDIRGELVPRVCNTLDSTTSAIDEVAPTLTVTRENIQRIGTRVDYELQGVKPILDNTAVLIETVNGIAVQGERIVANGADVTDHYKKMLLHPTIGQRIKGWVQLGMAVMTAWANTKILF